MEVSSKAASCPLVSHLWLFYFLQNIHILAEYMFFGFVSLPMAPTITPFFLPLEHGPMLFSTVVKDTGRAPPCHEMFVSDTTSGGSGHPSGGLWHCCSERANAVSFLHSQEHTTF